MEFQITYMQLMTEQRTSVWDFVQDFAYEITIMDTGLLLGAYLGRLAPGPIVFWKWICTNFECEYKFYAKIWTLLKMYTWNPSLPFHL